MTKKHYKFYFIYLTKNIVNQKCYVGWHATNNLHDGYIGSGKALISAIKKYGENNFITGIIDFYDKSIICEKEIFWIKEKNSLTPNGYNLTVGGEGGDTWTLNPNKEEICKKISIKTKGKVVSEETREKMRNRIVSSETRHKLSKPKSKEHRNKLKKAWEKRRIEKPMTQETKNKIIKAQTGKHFHTNEFKENLKKLNSERVWSNEAKQKISKANKGRKFSNEINKKKAPLASCIYCGATMSIGNLARYHNNNCKFKSIS